MTVQVNEAGVPYVYDRGVERPRPIRLRDPHMQCPMVDCSTHVQPSAFEATLVSGVLAHLTTVHSVSETSGRLLAERAVREHVASLRKD